MEDRTCALSVHIDCGSRSDTVPREGRGHLYCKNSCRRSTSMIVDENDVVGSGEQAVPQTESTGGRFHTPS